jgi:hypothetical protein
MNDTVHSDGSLPDQPLVDTTVYGSERDDAVSDLTESAAITQHDVIINGAKYCTPQQLAIL